MSHHHHHHHGHSHDHSGIKNIKLAFFLNLAFAVFEIIGGFFVNSVAIISDALHDLGDSFSLGIAWYLEKKSNEKPNIQFTFGYKRFSLLGALINSLILIIGSGFVIYAAIERIIHPETTDAKGMFFFALIGVAVNGFAAMRLQKGHSMNEKVLSLHFMEDVLGWIAVLITSIIILFQEVHILDPILSLAITGYILFGVTKRLKETMYMFLQGAPKEVDLTELQNNINSIDKVRSIHHSHLWSLDEKNKIFTIHIVVSDINDISEVISIKNKVRELLKPTEVSHATIEIEFEEEKCFMDGRPNP